MTATMKDQSTKFVNNRTSTTLCPDISPSSSHFFEVLYIGRMKVSHKKVPDMFIDDALDKFKHLEKLKKEKEDNHNHDIEEEAIEKKNEMFSTDDVVKQHEIEHQHHEGMRRRSGSVGNLMIKKHELCKDNSIHPEQNRTMVFHVGRTDLRLISPDRKQVLLHKYLKDITSSVQGVKHVTHFAFICKETAGVEPPSYVAYLFNCQSSSVAEDLVSAISQASVNDKKTAVVSCEHCPMVWYHKLATELEGLNEKSMEEVLHKRLSCLPEDEYAIVQTKLGGAELPQGGAKEHIELIMMLLRAHCESKQARHVHDTIENRHEFLSHYLGGGAIFMKAKRSLTSSFDQLLKRRSSKDDIGPFLSLPSSATIKDIVAESRNESDSSDSPTEESGNSGSMMNLFMKLGNTPKTPQQDPRFIDVDKKQPRSWRQAIFNTVVTPSKVMQENQTIKKKEKQEYRDLWKKAIHQTRLLIRMEKENACLSARQEEANVKRIKLHYEELGTVDSSNFWDMIINEEKMCASSVMVNALKQGVPKTKRGDVWLHLVDEESSKAAPFDSSNFPNYDVPYEQLLTQLTSHQHAILIDLGRTFPNHKYFSSPLGPGQLALFNILKAYSLLDPEVGYCQGLSFIAAVLLLHMSEEDAFYLLRHLMFQRGIRTRYLPDMAALQVALYQFSRLLHDRHPELYKHFDDLEIHPTLYAAQWLLTLFTSQFSLGFVVRLFDLIFANSPNILFKMSLALLGCHKQELITCDSFELVMDYLKNKITNIDTIAMDKLLKEAVSMDISRELTEYGVEYHVLQEEMATPRPEAKKIKELEAANLSLTQQIAALNNRLQMETSNQNRLESSRASYMSQLNRLESEKKTLEVTVQTLGNFINDLLETHKEIQIPSDIARMVQQVNLRRRVRPQMSSPEIKLNLGKSKPEVAKNGIGRILTEEDKKALAARIESRLGKQIEEEVEIKKRSESPEPKLLKVTQSSIELGHHPLDSNVVATKFEGTTNLKKIQLAKTRTLADVKNIELKIVEKHTDSVSEKLKSTKNKVTRLFESCNDVFKREEHFDKPYGQETQLLIKSQAMPNKNGFLT